MIRLADDFDARVGDIVTAIDLDEDRGQCLGRRRILDGPCMPSCHAGFFGEPNDFVACEFFVPRYQHVTFNLHVLFEKVCGDVLKSRDDHDVFTQEILSSFTGASLFR